MKVIVKQVAGIDVAQKELVVALGRMFDDWEIELYAHKTFANTARGFETLIAWVSKQTGQRLPVLFVMEATGVYHESLAYYLDRHELQVSIVLPNKISNYSRTLDIRTITDKTASQAIARFGLERKLDTWKRPDPTYKKLRQLSRERNQLVEERTMVKNELHAEQAEAEPNKGSLLRIRKRIDFLNKQEKEIKQEIAALLKENKVTGEAVALVCTIPGIGLLTAAAILAESNGFELIKNKKQLASYAGLDVKQKQSGTSVNGKPRISKQGNRHLRKAMHLPALSAIRHDERFRTVFIRLVQKHGIKMKAAVAVQRRLLEMVFTIYKTRAPYQKDYLLKENTQQMTA
jgi:transposase